MIRRANWSLIRSVNVKDGHTQYLGQATGVLQVHESEEFGNH
jgi:hypothetical protein